ncbi:MAG: DUF937 domain-containing protein [Vicinamibacteria bacterium]|jgi:hypothetical protein|nr:DUF937 domain-containing protein [Vicinamibacteria bacterium]
MSSLMEILGPVLGGGALQGIARQTGVQPAQAESAIGMALPVLIGALNRNAQNPQGAAALDKALGRDHDGSLLDDLGGLLGGGGNAGAGAAILGHVLGGRQGAVENQIGQATGLDKAQVGQILALLAPIVMAALGRARGQQGGGFDLGALLGGAQADVQQRAPQSADLLTRILDRDGDGSVADDVAQMGAGLLGSLFGGKK